jgi:hypothetical protein
LLIPDGKLRCNICQQIKDKSDFYVRHDCVRGYQYKCKKCMNEYTMKYYNYAIKLSESDLLSIAMINHVFAPIRLAMAIADNRTKRRQKMKKTILILCVLILGFTGTETAFAAYPSLVTQTVPVPPPDYYQVTGIPGVTNVPYKTCKESADATKLHALCLDLSSLPVAAYTAIVKACSNVWGCGPSASPFTFTPQSQALPGSMVLMSVTD